MLRTAFIICLCYISACAMAQVPTLPTITNFSSKEYESDPQNFDVIQDQRGVMYFANTAGILEFDGDDWRFIKMAGPTLSMAINNEGVIFFGGGGIMGYLKPDNTGQLLPIYFQDTLPDEYSNFDKVWNVEAIDGKVYFNAFSEIFLYENTQLKAIKPKDEFHLSFKVNNELWVVEKSSGIYKVLGDKPSLIPNSDFFIGKSIFSILPYKDGKYLVATRLEGVFIFDPNDVANIKPFNKETNAVLGENIIYGGIRLTDGNYVYNTIFSGLFILNDRGDIVKSYSREDGLQTELVLKVFEDKFGQLWCGLDNGVGYIAYSSPYTIIKEGKAYNGAVNDIERNGEYLYLATNLGLYAGKVGFSDSVTVRDVIKGIGNVTGQCLDLARIDENIIVATDGVYMVNDYEAKLISTIDARTICEVRNYTPATFLAGGNGGLAVIQKVDGDWKEILRIEDFPEEVFRIVQDMELDNGKFNFWLTMLNTGPKLYTFNHDFSEWDVTVIKENGQPIELEVWSIDDKVVFAGLLEKSYYVVNYDSMKLQFPKDPMLEYINSCNIKLYRTKSSPDYGVWISSAKKIYHVMKSIEGEFSVDSMSFLISDLASVDAFYMEGNGVTWIGGTEGVVRYNQNAVRKEIGYYNCIIREVTLNKDSVIYNGYFDRFHEKGSPVFAYDYNSISFKYAAPFYDHMDELKYAVKLEGYDDDFSAWSASTEAFYTNLNEGKYRFVVKAKNIYGQISEIGFYEFEIKPPWYRTYWAYAVYLLAGILLIYIVVTLNAARLRKEKVHLEKIVKERTAELAEKNSKLEEFNTILAEQKGIVEQKNKDITDSILYAEKIQRALLVSETEVQKVFKDHFVMYKPKSILSGDFYWFHNDEDSGISAFACVDCTGHGVPGALMSMIGHSFLNEIIVENKIHDPGEVLNKMRDQVIRALGDSDSKEASSKDGMDMVLGMYHAQSRTLKYAGANNPLWIVSEKETLSIDDQQANPNLNGNGRNFFEIKGDKQPVGAYVGKLKPFATHEVQLNPNDIIYASTDGYPDQFGGSDGKKFKYKRFKELLFANASLDMKSQKEELKTVFTEWKGTMEQIDDVCVVGIKV